jgi:hypothetical protein
MVISDLWVETERAPSELKWDENEIMVAALAATLVVYRRETRERSASNDIDAAGENWRLVARMEQLRGGA